MVLRGVLVVSISIESCWSIPTKEIEPFSVNSGFCLILGSESPDSRNDRLNASDSAHSLSCVHDHYWMQVGILLPIRRLFEGILLGKVCLRRIVSRES